MSAGLKVFRRQQDELIPVALLEPGTLVKGFEESTEYFICVDSMDSCLYIDDAPVARDASGKYWRWSPGFYAGEVLIEHEHPDVHEPTRYKADVAASSQKSGRVQFLEYLSQIADYAPELLCGTEPARYRLGGRADMNTSIWMRYARLRSFIDSYLNALHAITSLPLVRNRHHREQMPVHLARKVDITSIRRLEANPRLLSAIAGNESGSCHLSIIDNRIDVPFNEPTFDHPANQLIALQLSSVRRLVERLYIQFRDMTTETAVTETEIESRIPRKLSYLEQAAKLLGKIARQQPFCETSLVQPGVAALNVVAGSPHYERTYRLGLRILRQGIAGLVDDEQHYLPPTWQIYETWCFVILARQLQRLLADYDWRLQATAVSADMVLEGEKGNSLVRLYFQLVCRSLGAENHYGYFSISKERRPDIVFEIRNGDKTQFVCLDSKYSASRRAILEAMSSAHIYHDSIRNREEPPFYSVLLVPRNQSVAQLSSEDYISRHGVGVISLASENDAEDVVKRLADWLI